MKRLPVLVAICSVLALAAPPAVADHNADIHSGNMAKIATWNDGSYVDGSDIAFWGDRAVFGNLSPGGFRLLDVADPAKPKLISQFKCNGSQSDVSIWEDLVFVSVDGPRANPECNSTTALQQQVVQGTAFEGIRIVSIADPAKPVQVKTIETDCGSHTHTLVPDPANGRVLLYVLSYPLTSAGVDCNHAGHRKISVIEVPLANPTQASVIGTPSVAPAIGCHDVTVLMEAKLAAAACITESQIWDISDLAAPRILSHIVNPLINIHHSSAFSWDGKTLVLGDELGGAAVAAGCLTNGTAPLGALWFYDVSNPSSPTQVGRYVIPRQHLSIACTAHNFNIVPLTSDKDVLVTAWYNGGTAVIDFTNPASPQEIGHYAPQEGEAADAWSSYWYNGAIYVNNLGSRGLDVLTLDADVVDGALELAHLNAQAQEPLPAAKASGKQEPKVLGTRDALPATGVGWWLGLAMLLGTAAFTLSRWLRRA